MDPYEEFMKKLDEYGVEWLDIQLTDLAGTLHHVTIHRSLVNRENLERGFGKLDLSLIHI